MILEPWTVGVCSGKLHQHTVNFPECCWEYTNFLMPDLQPVSGVRYMRYLPRGSAYGAYGTRMPYSGIRSVE